jgi:hypothetical protein
MTKKHGRLTEYKKNGCRCDKCRAANRAYNQQRAWRLAQEKWGLKPPLMVDPAPAVEHIRQLRQAGMGAPQIAKHTGLSAALIGFLATGKSSNGKPIQRIHRDTMQRIMTCPIVLAPKRDQVTINSLPALLKACCLRGWTMRQIAEKTGYSYNSIYSLTWGTCRIRRDYGRHIYEVCTQMRITDPPQDTPQQRTQVAKTKAWARKNWPTTACKLGVA